MAFSTSDTIVAIATPPGRGGIGVVRISGPSARAIAAQLTALDRALEPRRATFTTVAPASAVIDQVIATFFPGPHSYTGEDVVELSAHGSPVVLREIVRGALNAGARLAEPGEFTLRGFVNGRIDLPQAEAVADLIDSVTPLQARAACDQLHGTLTEKIGSIEAALFDTVAHLEASVDFPEEGYHFVDRSSAQRAIAEARGRTKALLAGACRGRMIREGFQVAIVGKPNVGKSSLFNALAGAPRAIVTPVAGTTRDLVTEALDLDGFRITLVDTAGIRETDDEIESEGVARSAGARRAADIEVIVLDGSRPLDADDARVLAEPDRRRIVIRSKADLPHRWDGTKASVEASVSVVSGEGLDALRRRIVAVAGGVDAGDRPEITNVRHIALVERADQALLRADHALADGLSEEFVLADLQEALAALDEITGRRTTDELLEHIFARFCIGK